MAKYDINLVNVRQLVENVDEELASVKTAIERKLNLERYTNNIQPVCINKNTLYRVCLIVGLSDKGKRSVEDIGLVKLGAGSARFQQVFSKPEVSPTILLLLKMRYSDVDVDLSLPQTLCKVISYEILRGRDVMMMDGALDTWFNFVPTKVGGDAGSIPELRLVLGEYANNGMEASIDINTKSIPNTQIVIAGSTGSGKTNLLMTLISQIRSLSTDTNYPVNFLLFDYKGEFSDEKNRRWLEDMQVSSSAVLNPIQKPLPFNPFRSMVGKSINEINLEASTLASALASIFGARVSATMDMNLREAINDAYKASKGMPITFKEVADQYQRRIDKDDTISNSLHTLVSAKIFDSKDDVKLMNESFIINLGKYPKEGMIAKAIVYFTIAKLNSIYDDLDLQEKNNERVELRHFTIIDEAHYMLSFKNQPLKNLIAVGRNKGMSIILATQNMESYKSEFFDFYANAYYPMIMRQQQVNRQIVSGLFGGNSSETNEICQEISNLQLGEMLMKDNEAAALGMGKRWKKIKVTHLI